MSTEFRHRFDMNGNDVGAYVDLRTSRAQIFTSASGRFLCFPRQKRTRERELYLFPLQKIALSDVILARTICVPVACVVAGTCVVAGCQSMSKQTNNRKKSDKGRTVRKLMGGGGGRGGRSTKKILAQGKIK